MHAHPFFVHPYAQGQVDHGVSIRTRREQPSRERAASAMDGTSTPERRSRPPPATREMMAEMKVSLAAHQLSEQVKESKRFWQKFQDEYTAEVKSIKLYVGADILQQIWRKKVVSKDKHNRVGKDELQFDIQTMKLESCLNQLEEATKVLVDAWSSDYSSDYDSRQHHLTKMRVTGDLVVSLSKRAIINETACVDLLGELAELEKFIDPKSPAASSLHRFDKRQSQNATRSGKAKSEGLKRADNKDTNKQAENDYDYSHEGQEHEAPNWADDNEAGAS